MLSLIRGQKIKLNDALQGQSSFISRFTIKQLLIWILQVSDLIHSIV